jgi:perosamine synthetase
LSILAINGGTKVRNHHFPKHPTITNEEKTAVMDVLDSGNISTFVASPGDNFLGGVKIKEFENNFANFIGTKFAIAFNSASSALHAAVASVGVRPGEEVIVPPYTFTSTATSALMNNSIPVFADVKSDTYCIDPEKIPNVTSKLSKAIIPVHLFGHPCDMDEIKEYADSNDLKIIEDCAQAPGAEYKGKKVGTMGDCGIFSFQETKNMMTGEGGMLVTDNEEIAKIARMVRNHGEVLLSSDKSRSYKSEILGWGYRMTEMEAALGIVQLKKLEKMNDIRIKLADHLTKFINSIEGLKHTKYDSVKHVYYVYAFSYNEKTIGVSRKKFCEAMNAEGIPTYGGYVKPLYLNPLYLEKRAFAFRHYTGNVEYKKGICPTAEYLHEEELIFIPVCRPPAKIEDMNDIITAIKKILENKNEL